jgi:outer membrane protein assembly factor BamB
LLTGTCVGTVIWVGPAHFLWLILPFVILCYVIPLRCYPTLVYGPILALVCGALLGVWALRTSHRILPAAPAIAICTLSLALYVVPNTGPLTGQSWLRSIDARTGVQVWAIPLASPAIGRAAFADGTLLVNGGSTYLSEQGNLFAVDSTTGQELWHTTTNGERCGVPVSGDAPTAANGIVVARGADGTPRGLQVRTGREIWRGDGSARIIGGNSDAVFVADRDGHRIRGLDRGTGSPRWAASFADTFPADGTPFWDTGSAVGVTIVAPRGMGSLAGVTWAVAINLSNGLEAWRYRQGYVSSWASAHATMVLGGGLLAVPEGPPAEDPRGHPAEPGSAIVAEGTGDPLRHASSKVVASDGSRSYAYTDDQHLAAQDPRTGANLWEVPIEYIDHQLVAADGLVMLRDLSGPIAIDGATGKTLWRTGFRLASSQSAVADGRVLMSESGQGCGPPGD